MIELFERCHYRYHLEGNSFTKTKSFLYKTQKLVISVMKVDK